MKYVDIDGMLKDLPLTNVQPLVSPDPDNRLFEAVNGLKVTDYGIDNTPIGFIGYFGGIKAPDGYLICNGQAISREKYNDLFKIIGTIYGDGDGTTSFNVPDLIGKFPQGSSTVGEHKNAGLPNIEGNIAVNYISNDGYGTVHTQFDGALSRNNAAYGKGGRRWPTVASTGDSRAYPTLNLNASKSNAIYGKSDTVQPPALTLLPCIKAFYAKPVIPDSYYISSDDDNAIYQTPNGIKVDKPLEFKTRMAFGQVKYYNGEVNPGDAFRAFISKQELMDSLALKPGEKIWGGQGGTIEDTMRYVNASTSSDKLLVGRCSSSGDEIEVWIFNPTNDSARFAWIYLKYLIYWYE